MNPGMEHFKSAIHRIFNNWSGLYLAVEHGMGGRHGQKIALDIMNYVYEYCIQNDNVSSTELEDLLEELMDQELNTVYEDNSISEISLQLLKFLDLCKKGEFNEVDSQLNLLPENRNWLDTNIPIKIIRNQDDESSSDENESQEDEEEVERENENKVTDDQMEIDNSEPSKMEAECEPGWTVVKGRYKR